MKVVNDFSWMIGGPQGTGVDSSANLFAQACATAGVWVFGKREYHSNIKGKHSYFQVRVNQEPIHSHVDEVHILATFEDSTAKLHAHEVIKSGALIYDPTKIMLDDLNLKSGVITLPIDFNMVLRHVAEVTGEEYGRLTIMKNVIAVAASMALLRLDISHMEETLSRLFTGKKAKLVPTNMAAVKKAYEAVDALPDEMHEQFPYHLEPNKNTPKRLLIAGAQATALGKLKAGCRYQTYYPISPATDESNYLESHPEYGIAVVQCEDEIAAIDMALGAATTGVRASTATSGPGFSLMTEGLGWGGMNEVPIVVFNYQRGGPSTGLPTRHEQGDLLFSVFGGHGEYPRLVMAPLTIDDHFHTAFESFNYADKFQTPVVILNDKFLTHSIQTIMPFNESNLVVDRGRLATSEELEAAMADGKGFPRFRPDPKVGVSPRAYPGQEGSPYWMTGDEHDDYGHITESPETRKKMHEKRMNKYKLMLEQIPEDRQYLQQGEPGADITLVCWGTTSGVLLDALKPLKERGIKVNVLTYRMLNPFPLATEKILKKAKKLILVESNLATQLGALIRMRTGLFISSQIIKYTGRPMSLTEIVDGVEKIHKKQVPVEVDPVTGMSVEKVVLTYGL
ncbi:MAG: 2-oxoacid:acceptor oxidoreductase subunit alpha [bacterium]